MLDPWFGPLGSILDYCSLGMKLEQMAPMCVQAYSNLDMSRLLDSAARTQKYGCGLGPSSRIGCDWLWPELGLWLWPWLLLRLAVAWAAAVAEISEPGRPYVAVSASACGCAA